MGEPTTSTSDSELSVNLWALHERLVAQTAVDYDVHLSKMTRYLRSPLMPLNTNPLEWWKTQKNTYPKLSKAANVYLSTVATSVPADRLFFKAGQTITDRRNRISAKKLNKILFMQSIDKVYWQNI
ncbi:unnamed protein product [Psylliodes chrysocephalus]|uniref:HAT C-terminal dimerisation domain-containing protein n=1 Tax=Psylliodes chrysocephalus TaxID=3402493 RepID=A0A9P0DBR2_9CUCU|nr:unnamed protein product [Psylliodes chrysocephala]